MTSLKYGLRGYDNKIVFSVVCTVASCEAKEQGGDIEGVAVLTESASGQSREVKIAPIAHGQSHRS